MKKVDQQLVKICHRPKEYGVDRIRMTVFCPVTLYNALEGKTNGQKGNNMIDITSRELHISYPNKRVPKIFKGAKNG